MAGKPVRVGQLPLPPPTRCCSTPIPPRRDAAVTELHAIRAGEDERRHMLDILQRLHQEEVEGGGDGSSDDEGGGSEAEDDGGLSEETLHRLLAKVRLGRLQASTLLLLCCRVGLVLLQVSTCSLSVPSPPHPNHRWRRLGARWTLGRRICRPLSWLPSTGPWQRAS